MKHHLKLLSLLLTVWLLMTSCANQLKPDLAKLYKSSEKGTTNQPPVILVHGIMGSKLRNIDTLKELWFGSLSNLLFSNYKNIRLEIDPETLNPEASHISPYEIADKAAGNDYYQAIIHTLQTFGNYQLTELNTPVADQQRRLYVFTYDWRQDNVISAKKLSHFIEQLKLDHNNPNLKVDLVAHSMGGLVSRYYLRYGDQDVLNDNYFPMHQKAAKNVRKVVLLGTPNLGSVGSVESFITGLRIGLRKIPTEVLVTFPSIYQLFPHSIQSWLINIKGQTINRDVFDTRVWRRFQWSIFDPKVQQKIIKQFADTADGEQYLETLKLYFNKHIERARRFSWSLSVPIENPSHEIVVMGGDCSMTPAHLLVEEVNGESITRLSPSQIRRPLAGVDYENLMLAPGDGTVTKASLLARDVLDPTVPQHKYSFFPLDYAYFLCEDHSSLTSNINFEDNLLHILLSH